MKNFLCYLGFHKMGKKEVDASYNPDAHWDGEVGAVVVTRSCTRQNCIYTVFDSTKTYYDYESPMDPSHEAIRDLMENEVRELRGMYERQI